MKDLGPLFLIVVALLLFYAEMILSAKIPLFRDLGPFFYPIRYSLAQSFESGELPLWDRHLAMGFPLLANFQSGAFYPPNCVYLLFPFFVALKVNFLLHSLIAAAGAYFLAREWAYDRGIALISAVLFSLGGCVVSMLNLLNHFQTAVWLPWVIFFGERLSSCHRGCGITACALIATLQFLAGSPEIYAMTVVLYLISALSRKQQDGTSRSQVIFALLKINIFVTGLAMVQILPTLELLQETGRLRLPSFHGVTSWSLHPGNLLNLFLLERQVDTSAFDRFQSFTGLPAPFFMSLYMSALFPFGLWGWMLTGWRREKTVILLGVVFSLFASMGSYTPLYRLLYDYLPFAFLIRFPEKFFFVTFALLVYVTASGVNAGLSDSGRIRRFLLGPAVLCGFLAGLDILVRAGFFPGLLPPSGSKEIAFGMSLERQILLLLGLAALFWLWKSGKIRKPIIQALLFVIVLVDLCGAHRLYLFLTEQSTLSTEPELLHYIDESSQQRIFFVAAYSRFHPVAVLFPGAHSPAEDIAFGSQSLRPNAGRLWGTNYVQDIDPLARDSYDRLRAVAQQLSPGRLYQLLGNLSVRYLISQQPLSGDGIALLSHLPKYPLWLYRIDHALPKAYIVPQSVHEAEPGRIIQRLSAPDFDSAKEVILQEPLSLNPMGNVEGVAEIAAYAQTSVRIRASLKQRGILVLTDSFYPGWKVFVDGREQEIMRANFYFRAVQLTPGDHEVDFTYEPASLRWGFAVSLLTAGIFVVASLKKPYGNSRWTGGFPLSG